MTDISTVFRPTARPEERAADQRARRKRLLAYADERVRRLPVRLLLYTLGCSIGYYAVDLIPALLSYIILLTGDAVDCLALRTVVRREALVGSLNRGQRWATITSALQGITMVAGVSVYYFQLGEDANILFVIGALGLGAVNAAIVLPKNPTAAFNRLTFYILAPFLYVSLQSIWTKSWTPFVMMDVAGTMLVFCMLYMFLAFTKSGINNFKITQDLERQKSEMKIMYARMDRHQTELQQLSLVARHANDSVIITDRERRIVWVNDAFTRITGFTFADAKGQIVADLLTGADQELKAINTIDLAVEAGQPFRGEVQNVTRDGNRIWLDVNLFPVDGPDGEPEYYVSIERDVTESRKLAEQMSKARQAAEEGARAKAEFLANMSHEIRTPLTGVIGMADLLSETNLDEDQGRYTDTIRGSSQALMAIINDILDLSKLDAGRMELHPVSFSPRACLQETLDLLMPAARSKGLELSLRVDDLAPEFIKADDGRLRQVVTNIVGNAIKFTEDGGVYITLSHAEDSRGKRLICEVTDTGIGISKENQERIFDHFSQAEAATTRKFGGTGLGLSISKHILDVMGGAISVDSEVGQGATFHLEIPYEEADLRREMTGSLGHEGPRKLLPGLRVVVAEDNKTNRFLLKKFFGDQPVELAFAKDGVEAVEVVQTFAPDLVLMDMSMPRKSGLDATREIRELPIDQPAIVALTAHAFDEEMQACLDAGMDDFLTKPIRKAVLIDWIAQFQDRRLVEASDKATVPPIEGAA
ncbi:MAG: response regulator [Shimia sp.]|uniref:PAS domain-containing hybrid sensor histidine kinase/response regulator n=1 Tax=Shimia sp. TaxID=1954381 RepID=UPI001B196182|nr:ATP-binding protein [Shimia sp.]MBO6897671.1 response regulator [Shimia sp.]